MKTKGLQTFLYSGAGVAAMFVILVAFNWIASHAKARLDLTEERAYTLSQGTRNILAKLDTPVQIRFYCTRGDNRMPIFLKNHAQQVEDLLDEYRQASKGRIEIQKLDPQPDSDAEDSAKLDGIEPRTLSLGTEPIYLGLSVTMLDQKETVPFLDPQAARLLEYEVSRAISRVMSTERPVLGLMSPLPLAGQQMNPMMMQRGMRGQQPWFFYTQLQRNFNVKQIDVTADKIPDDVKVLVVVHPKGLRDAAQYAIDQFVLRGGKLVAFLDPAAALDAQQAQGMMPAASSSSLDKVLKAWGLSFDATKVVADMNYVTRMQQGRAPAVLSLNENAVNKDDVVTAGADNLLLAFAGAFTGTAADGLKQTVLVKSSKTSQLIDPMMAQMGGESVITNFSAPGTEYPLAVRLTGRFKSAFPEGKPAAAASPAPSPGEPTPTPTPAAEPGWKEASVDSAVVLGGDSDFLQDQLAVDEGINPFGGQRVVMPRNVNIAFAEGAIEQLAGDSNLIAVRSRASRERPFTVVKQMQADAEANYRSKIRELETSLAEAQRKLNELQRARTGEQGQRFVLSPEQQTEIANFRRKEGEVKKALKEERKRLRSDIDALENRIKWVNIAGMPLVVVAAGMFLAFRRRRMQAAT